MYKQIQTDKEIVTANGTKFEPVATLADEFGGRMQILTDDHCYVVAIKKEKFGALGDYYFMNHITYEAFNVLKTLPEPI